MIIKQIFKACFLTSLFALLSCLGEQRAIEPNLDSVAGGVLTKEDIAKRCIRHEFQQGQDDKLFGRDCIEGKEIRIKSASSGEFIPLMSTDGGEESVVIEEGVDFINKIYSLEYDILEGKGDDKEIPFLLDFIREGEEFQGIPNQRYSFIFKTVGNYLVLYKATEDKNNIPYNERTSMLVEDTKGGDSLYMVPFIGYPIEYCKAESIRNNFQEITNLVRAECDSDPSEERNYIRISIGRKQVFQYLDKQDIFPADYFDGDWFFARVRINSNIEGEIAAVSSALTTLKKDSDSLVVIDSSGNIIRDVNEILYNIPVEWKEFELDKDNERFSRFGERPNENKNYRTRSHLKVLFQKIEDVHAIEEVVISSNYFSFVYLNRGKNKVVSKVKVSLLRKSHLKSSQFKPRRWFLEEWNKTFALLPTIPQVELKSFNLNVEDRYSHIRILKFDTGLYTKEEKSEGTKTIKWYFSKNSTKENYYREVAQEAIAVYNRAFEIIADGEAPKIQFELVKDEEKSLGDMRYNVINLIKISDISLDRSGLHGFAPSYQNPETGQSISGVSNIAIHSIEEKFNVLIRDYTRYEIFQRPKLSEEENKIHVVSDYIRWKIQKECKELEAFIDQKRGALLSDYRVNLEDFDLIRACASKVSRPFLLMVILHEMGHNCSKSHNFECSVDEKNFYKDLDEIKKYFPSADLSDLSALQKVGINPIPKTSCVMDYSHYEVVPLSVLGKNDLMVLRYVYEDELELEGHEFENRKVHKMEFDYENLENQTSLSSNSALMGERKKYLNCSSQKQRLGCDAFDYGASYKEIVENRSLNFKRQLNLRYAYDLDEDLISIENLKFFKSPLEILKMSKYHTKWLNLRDSFLQNEGKKHLLNYHLDDEKSITDYEKKINPNDSDNKGLLNQEYKDYYPIVDIFTETIKFAWFQRPLHCRVESKDGERTDIELNYLIYSHLNTEHGKDLYVIDCYSDQVVKFLNENNLELIEQYGIQNFVDESLGHFGTYAISNDENKRLDIVSLKYILFVLGNSEDVISSLRNLSFLREIDKKSKESLLDINQYASKYDIVRNKYLLSYVHRYATNDQFNSSVSARESYKKDIGYLIKTLGTGPASFYKKIEEPLKLGRPIEYFQSSFLKTLYEEYKNSNLESSFESYVKSRKEVALVDSNKGIHFFIPVKKDSFSYKMAIKYNEGLNKIKELEAKPDLSLLEKFHKAKLEKFRNNFFDFEIYSYQL